MRHDERERENGRFRQAEMFELFHFGEEIFSQLPVHLSFANSSCRDGGHAHTVAEEQDHILGEFGIFTSSKGVVDRRSALFSPERSTLLHGPIRSTRIDRIEDKEKGQDSEQQMS